MGSIEFSITPDTLAIGECATCGSVAQSVIAFLKANADVAGGTDNLEAWLAGDAGRTALVRVGTSTDNFILLSSVEEVTNCLDIDEALFPCGAISIVLNVSVHDAGDSGTATLTLNRPARPTTATVTTNLASAVICPSTPIITNYPPWSIDANGAGALPQPIIVGTEEQPALFGTISVSGLCPNQAVRVVVLQGEDPTDNVCNGTITSQNYQGGIRILGVCTDPPQPAGGYPVNYIVRVDGPCFTTPPSSCSFSTEQVTQQLQAIIAQGIQLIEATAAGDGQVPSEVDVVPSVSTQCLRGARGEISYTVTYRVTYKGCTSLPPIYAKQELRFLQQRYPKWQKYFPSLWPCECAVAVE